MHVDLKDVTNSVAIGKGFDSNILGACIQKDAQGHQSYSVSGSALSIFLTNYKKPGKFPVGKDPASGSQLDANLRVPGQAFASGVANSGSLTITDLKNGTFELDFEKVALSKNGGLPTSGVTVHASGWFKFFTCP